MTENIINMRTESIDMTLQTGSLGALATGMHTQFRWT